MNQVLKKYEGSLTPEQVTVGISAAQKNAQRLLDDAKLLLDAGRLPSAAALAILSIEERGKTFLLKRLALDGGTPGLKKTWREFRSHRSKNVGWVIPQLALGGARTLGGMAAATDTDAEHTWLLDALKQIALYTDCLGEANWSVPTEVIDEELVRALIASAEMMWGGRPVSKREIELWVEIVGPHVGQASMPEAVVQHQKALVAEGLSDTPPESLEAFMRGEPVDLEFSAKKRTENPKN